VNSAARTNQYSGLNIAPGTRINGGIHGVTTGNNTASTTIRTDANTRALSNTRALANSDDRGSDNARLHRHKTKHHHRD
jgi:hypothetical protein